MIDPVFCFPPVVGLGENLETTNWHLDGSGVRFACDVRCTLCGLSAGERVLAHGEMSNMDYRFWLLHFQAAHPEVLPEAVRVAE